MIKVNSDSLKINELEEKNQNLNMQFKEITGSEIDEYNDILEINRRTIYVFFEVDNSELKIFELEDLINNKGSFDIEYTSSEEATREWEEYQGESIDIDLPANLKELANNIQKAQELESYLANLEKFGIKDIRLGE